MCSTLAWVVRLSESTCLAVLCGRFHQPNPLLVPGNDLGNVEAPSKSDPWTWQPRPCEETDVLHLHLPLWKAENMFFKVLSLAAGFGLLSEWDTPWLALWCMQLKEVTDLLYLVCCSLHHNPPLKQVFLSAAGASRCFNLFCQQRRLSSSVHTENLLPDRVFTFHFLYWVLAPMGMVFCGFLSWLVQPLVDVILSLLPFHCRNLSGSHIITDILDNVSTAGSSTWCSSQDSKKRNDHLNALCKERRIFLCYQQIKILSTPNQRVVQCPSVPMQMSPCDSYDDKHDKLNSYCPWHGFFCYCIVWMRIL